MDETMFHEVIQFCLDFCLAELEMFRDFLLAGVMTSPLAETEQFDCCQNLEVMKR